MQSVLILASPDAFRGRVMGLFGTMTAGGIPIAALIGGVLGSAFGAPATVGLAAVIILGYTTWLIAGRRTRVIGVDHLLVEIAVDENAVDGHDVAATPVPGAAPVGDRGDGAVTAPAERDG
jgi:hypothetical protein